MKKLLLLMFVSSITTLTAHASCLQCNVDHCALANTGACICVTGQPGKPCETYYPCVNSRCVFEPESAKTRGLIDQFNQGKLHDVHMTINKNCELGRRLLTRLHKDSNGIEVRIALEDYVIESPNGSRVIVRLR